jgi:hypothetical protein
LDEKGMSLCELLAGSREQFIKHYNAIVRGEYMSTKENMPLFKLSTHAGQFIKALAQWFDQAGGKKDWFLPLLMEAGKCSGRGQWTYHTGKVYRGVLKSLESVDFVLEDKFASMPDAMTGEFLVGTATYKSIYPMQSWSTKAEVTFEFANTDYNRSVQWSYLER